MTQYQVQKLHIIKREVKIIKNHMAGKLEEKVMFYFDTPTRNHIDSVDKGNENINRHGIHRPLEKQTGKRIPI